MTRTTPEPVLSFQTSVQHQRSDSQCQIRGRGGLVVRSRLWGRRVRDPIPPKIGRVWGLLYAKSYVVAKRPPIGVELWRGAASSGVVLVI
ncbi:hypothetical protein AVEN_115208-1 [Araneus ventricosus]|uniref:Uncharacterized protein n=1 Tax=Araneus ventricosus TaxID=182803 RepID=A0A4Y1ZYN7_ARAVE|nr:hypothetical protein AVEN_115208-1 [Araneus ventricosus]